MGHGLKICVEMRGTVSCGLGLQATRSFVKGEPITQYEGHIIWDSEVETLHSTSHVASPTKGGPHINGFRATDDVAHGTQPLERLDGLGGIPISFKQFRGLGGASVVNAESTGFHANAKFVDWKGSQSGMMGLGDSTARFLIATRHIEPGEFIIADYKKMFLRSSKCTFRPNSSDLSDTASFSNQHLQRELRDGSGGRGDRDGSSSSIDPAADAN